MDETTASRAVVAVLAAALVAIGSAQAGPQRTSSGQTAAPDPLVGTWQTAAIPLPRIRAAFTAHGYTRLEIDRFFKNQAFLNNLRKTVKCEMRFYRDRDGKPFQVVVFWDPSTGPEPSYTGADHGPYEVLSGGRLTRRGTEPPTDGWVTTYGYAVTGRHLRLRFIKFVQPSETETQRLAYQKLFILYAVAPYRRVN